MPVSWEESANPDFHGYLKLLDTQKDGYDLHATFVKTSLPHLSLYVNDLNGGQKEYMAQLKQVWNKLSLEQSARSEFTQRAPSSADVLDGFLTKVQEKHTELTTQAKSTKVSSGFGSALAGTKATWGGPKNDVSDTTTFPSLPSKPASKPVVKQGGNKY